MKLILSATVVGLVMLCGSASSQTTSGPSAAGQGAAAFAGHKAKMLANIDQRTTALAGLRNCVAGAIDHQAVRACEEQHRASVAAL